MSADLILVWPGLETWSKVYHFFHYLNISEPIPSFITTIIWAITILTVLLNFSQIPFVASLDEADSHYRGLDWVTRLVALDQTDYHFTSPILLGIGIVFWIILLLVFLKPYLLVRRVVTFIMRLFLQSLTPLATVITSAILQTLTEESVLAGSIDGAVWTSLLAFLVFASLLVFTSFMFGQPLRPPSPGFCAWNHVYYAVYIIITCLIQQLWTVVVLEGKYWGCIPLGCALVMSVLLIWHSLSLPFMTADMNIFCISVSIGLTLIIIINIVIWIVREYVFLLMCCVLVAICLASVAATKIYGCIGAKLMDDLHGTSGIEKDREMSDSSGENIVPDEAENLNYILLIHYLVVCGYAEVSDVAMKITDRVDDAEVLAECLRILVMSGSVPTTVWGRIINVVDVGVSVMRRPTLCELHYEAMKREQLDTDLVPVCEGLNVTKLAVHESLMRLSGALIDADKDKVDQALDEYVYYCEEYETSADVYLKSGGKSILLLENYYDYLVVLRGDYMQAAKFKQDIETQKRGVLRSVAASAEVPGADGPIEDGIAGENEITAQQLVTQQVAMNFTSKVFPKAVAMLIVCVVFMSVGFTFRPRYLFIDVFGLEPERDALMDVLASLRNMHLNEIRILVEFVIRDSSDEDVISALKTLNLPWEGEAVDVPSFDRYVESRAEISDAGRNIADEWFRAAVAGTNGRVPASLFGKVVRELEVVCDEEVDANEDDLKAIRDMVKTMSDCFPDIVTLIDDYVIWNHDHMRIRFLVYTCALVIVIGGLICATLVVFVRFFAKEFKLFTDVMFRIDEPSITTFREDLEKKLVGLETKIQREPTGGTSRAGQDDGLDDDMLELDEIELEDDDLLAAPIDFPNAWESDHGDGDEGSSMRNVIGKYDVRRARGLILSIVILAVIDVVVLIGLFVINVMTYDLTMDIIQELVGKILDIRQMLEYGSDFAYSAVDSSWSFPSLLCNDFFEYSAACETIMLAAEGWTGTGVDLNFANAMWSIVDKMTTLIVEVSDAKEMVLSTVMLNYNVSWAVACCAEILVTFCVTIIFMVHLKHAKSVFSGLRALLLLIPAKYFSTIAALREMIEVHTSEEAEEKEREAAPGRILKHSTDSIIYIDHEAKIIEAGQSTMAVFAYKKEHLIGLEVTNLLPTFMSAVQFEEDFVDEFDIEGIRSDGEKLQLHCTFLSREVSILILVDLTEQTSIRAQIRESRVELHGLLKRMMPPPFAVRFLNGDTRIAVRKEEVVMGGISIIEYDRGASHERLMQVTDMLYSKCDRAIKSYPSLSRICADRGTYRFVGGIVSDSDAFMGDIVYEAFCFAKKIQQTVNAKVARFVSGTWRFQACLYTSGPAIGAILRRELPIFDVWCAAGDPLRTLMQGMQDDRAIRVTAPVKNYLSEHELEVTEEDQPGLLIPTFAVQIYAN